MFQSMSSACKFDDAESQPRALEENLGLIWYVQASPFTAVVRSL